MSKRVFGMISIIISLFLVGCIAQYKTSYTYIPPSDDAGLSCIQRCETSKLTCQKMCHGQYVNCKPRDLQLARVKFEQYQARQLANGHPMQKRAQDFYLAQGCKKQRCSCEVDFRACYQMCGGKTKAERICVSNC